MESVKRVIRSLSIAALLGATEQVIYAHHGPGEMIAMFTQRMEADGATPVLLYKRAMEWRTLGELDKAIDDLHKSIELSPKFVDGIELLAEVYLAQGSLEKSQEVARTGLQVAQSAQESAAFQMVLARALEKSGKSAEALKTCNAAFDSFPRGNLDWYLIRGTLQQNLGHHAERVADFRRGYEETGSIVLRNSMVDAMIDAGRAEEILPVIDQQVDACRLKSTWLLRRARAKISLGNQAQAVDDLNMAVAELEKRIHPIHPDVTLVVDRGLARALLGNEEGAREDLERARELGVSPSMLHLLLQELSSADFDRKPDKSERS
ncbi:MAG: hypothetical protein R3F19_04645 [Verrucomicrobiales bacterium]